MLVPVEVVPHRRVPHHAASSERLVAVLTVVVRILLLVFFLSTLAWAHGEEDSELALKLLLVEIRERPYLFVQSFRVMLFFVCLFVV